MAWLIYSQEINSSQLFQGNCQIPSQTAQLPGEYMKSCVHRIWRVLGLQHLQIIITHAKVNSLEKPVSCLCLATLVHAPVTHPKLTVSLDWTLVQLLL